MKDDQKLFEAEIEGRRVVVFSKPQGDIELFVDGVHGLSISQHLVKFNLYTVHPWQGGEDEEYREVVARIVMTLPTFVSVVRFLMRQIEELSGTGLLKIEERTEQKKPEGAEPS